MRVPVTLQINLAPPDAAYIDKVIPHQLRVFAGQVDEILLTLDLLKPRSGQFAANWDRWLPVCTEILEGITRSYPKARVDEVDYARSARQAVGEKFFGGRTVPIKDFRGGPYYSYFYGLSRAGHRTVLHLDCDMMFGGISQTWLAEASSALSQDPDLLLVNPLPGPPPGGGRLPEAVTDPNQRVAPDSYRFEHVSSRLFLIDLERFQARICPLRPVRERSLKILVGAMRARRNNFVLPEHVISRAMKQAGMHRLDMLGRPPGLYAVHPFVRTDAYFENLSAMIHRLERGVVAEEQRGHYNLVPSMIEPDA
jgi:hypothetical protein